MHSKFLQTKVWGRGHCTHHSTSDMEKLGGNWEVSSIPVTTTAFQNISIKVLVYYTLHKCLSLSPKI